MFIFQPQTRDDIGIKEETRQIKCESSPPTPRSLRLERVAQALAQSSDDLQQHRSVIAQPAFIRYAAFLLGFSFSYVWYGYFVHGFNFSLPPPASMF